MLKQHKLFWIAFALTIGWIIVMRPYTPKNIIAFELAKTVAVAEKLIADWGAEGVAKATTSIYMDFIFIVLYSTTIMMGCRVAANYSKNEKLIILGAYLGMAIWVAGLLDVAENVSMLQTINNPTSLTTSVAYYSAALKFLIVILCLLFIISAAFMGVTKKTKG